jgi:hypothetical protein
LVFPSTSTPRRRPSRSARPIIMDPPFVFPPLLISPRIADGVFSTPDPFLNLAEFLQSNGLKRITGNGASRESPLTARYCTRVSPVGSNVASVGTMVVVTTFPS